MYYGLVNQNHLSELALYVCNALGHGANKTAHALLIETAMAETQGGEYKDNTLLAGMGLTQFDALPFQDTKDRTSQKNKDRLIEAFDIDLDLIEWEYLRYNPLLSLIMTRLKYKLIAEDIPSDMIGRAKYYKIWYNSLLGKSSVKKYLEVNGFDMSNYNDSWEVK